MAKNINPHLDPTLTAQASSAPIKGSVQKINLVCRMITGMSVHDAVLQLQFSPKGHARPLLEVLQAAISNAENNEGLDIDELYVSEVKVGKAFALKRFSARGRGRSSRIMKPFSKVTVFVTQKETTFSAE